MTKRVPLWDNIKLLLIVLVVVGHLIDNYTMEYETFRSLFLFIYSFHMPLFIFVAGVFYNNKNIVSKILFYVSAGFLLKILSVILCYIKGEEPVFSLLSDGGLPWFMFALAAFNLIMYLLKNQNKIILLVVSVIVACFAGFDQNIGDFLYLSRIIVFFPFFLLGTIINPQSIIKIKERCKWLIFASLAVLLIWAYFTIYNLNEIYGLRYFFTGRNPFFGEFYYYGPLYRLLCYVISAITGLAVVFLVPNIKIGFITKMGSRTVDVYFWHIFAYSVLCLFISFDSLVASGPAGKALYLLFAVVLALVLSLGGPFSFPLTPLKSLCFKPFLKK